MTVKIVNHPLVLQKVSCLRDKRIKAKEFRDLVYELTLLLTMKATSTLDLKETKRVSILSLFVCYEAILMTAGQLESPLGLYQGVKLKDHIGVFPIMRAGNGMIDGVLTLVPNATVCHLGLYREKSTLLPGISSVCLSGIDSLF